MGVSTAAARRSKEGVFTRSIEVRHDHWKRDITDLGLDVHNLVLCKQEIVSVTITAWRAYDECGVLRGSAKELKLDITEWFLGDKGPVINDAIKPLTLAFIINQQRSQRTPWVKDVRLGLNLSIVYKRIQQ
ncbi:hypothetical protein SPECIALG_280 [Erwinia phage vB_EamM_Special G]|uniref:Uncharacterized protein n=1 Tax=Erwinia phage vB_EamM_Special G TaxID=1815989 RepID=A0A191ZCH8_9CAUD|nr:hypothetical protein FDI00_gp279 [Erwinia phage vB_EamM_Special G]ANJ65091.1 hypothetical protein SPECIALG_280 [Erwinia phage vB_EamM_Special G]